MMWLPHLALALILFVSFMDPAAAEHDPGFWPIDDGRVSQPTGSSPHHYKPEKGAGAVRARRNVPPENGEGGATDCLFFDLCD